jgi:hypothetical protein
MKELSDPRWRLSNLYSIKEEETGKRIPFEPRPEQTEVIDHLLDRPNEPLYIIKSRRLGMSTTIGLFMADQAAFNAGFKGSLLDQTQSDAHRKMADIMRFGINSLPELLLNTLTFPKKNDGELTLLTKGEPETSTSTIYAGMNARGGTTSMLWISEWGPIAATDFSRSREIRTGALPSARLGRRVIETTWYGGKGGDLWELIKPILENDPNAEGRVMFFPWHSDPSCVRIGGAVTPEVEEYFRDLGDRLGKSFEPEQKRWYVARRLEQGIFVKREYPSTLEEAMSAPVEGAIYGNAVTSLRDRGRVGPSEVDHSALVHTFWDLGSPENTIVWYAQFVADEVRLVDIDYGFDGDLVQRIAHMLAKGYPLGTHYLPHDAAATKTSGRSFQAELRDSGLPNTRIIPRTQSIWIGINRLLQMFPRLAFRTPATDQGLEALENYHTRPTNQGAISMDEPVHDWSSHAADALRGLAEATMHGLVEGGSRAAIAGRRNSRPQSQVIMGFRGDEKPKMQSRSIVLSG